MTKQVDHLKQLDATNSNHQDNEVQCIIDKAILEAQQKRQEKLMADFEKQDPKQVRAERLSICKEVVPILIATCNPNNRIPSRIAEDAVRYADALLDELDK